MKNFGERAAGRSFDRGYGWTFHAPFVEAPCARLAAAIMERWALVAAIPDGEDSAGRQKLRLPEPGELVARACAIADAAQHEFEMRGWLMEMPSIAEAEAEWKAQNTNGKINDR